MGVVAPPYTLVKSHVYTLKGVATASAKQIDFDMGLPGGSGLAWSLPGIDLVMASGSSADVTCTWVTANQKVSCKVNTGSAALIKSAGVFVAAQNTTPAAFFVSKSRTPSGSDSDSYSIVP